MRAMLQNYLITILWIDITNIQEQEPLNDHVDDSCLAIVERLETYPCVLKIKLSVNSTIISSFRNITAGEMLVQLQNLDPKKDSPQEAIPPKILKSNAVTLCFHRTKLFNKLIEASSFQDGMKNADVTSIFKKDGSTKKRNIYHVAFLQSRKYYLTD